MHPSSSGYTFEQQPYSQYYVSVSLSSWWIQNTEDVGSLRMLCIPAIWFALSVCALSKLTCSVATLWLLPNPNSYLVPLKNTKSKSWSLLIPGRQNHGIHYLQFVFSDFYAGWGINTLSWVFVWLIVTRNSQQGLANRSISLCSSPLTVLQLLNHRQIRNLLSVWLSFYLTSLSGKHFWWIKDSWYQYLYYSHV